MYKRQGADGSSASELLTAWAQAVTPPARPSLVKRCIILCKAWAYYEARILGAHHSLLSSYTLEVLVIYVLVHYHERVRTPCALLCALIDVVRAFDWTAHALSLYGPVPLSALPLTAPLGAAALPLYDKGRGSGSSNCRSLTISRYTFTRLPCLLLLQRRVVLWQGYRRGVESNTRSLRRLHSHCSSTARRFCLYRGRRARAVQARRRGSTTYSTPVVSVQGTLRSRRASTTPRQPQSRSSRRRSSPRSARATRPPPRGCGAPGR